MSCPASGSQAKAQNKSQRSRFTTLVGTIHDQMAGLGRATPASQQAAIVGRVARLTLRECKAQGEPRNRGNQMDLGGASAPRFANGLRNVGPGSVSIAVLKPVATGPPNPICVTVDDPQRCRERAARTEPNSKRFNRRDAYAHSHTIMKAFFPLLLVSLTATVTLAQAPAGYYSRAVFSDDFTADGFGKRWGHYKSGSIVKDGVLVGITPEKSDHSAVDNVVIDPERDLEVSVKFRYVSDKAKSFNVWFDDKNYKGSHAGHICNVNVSPTSVAIGDAKTGNFTNEIYERKKLPTGLTAEDKALLLTKNKSFPVKLTLQDWHTLVIRTKGDEIEVNIDGNAVGTFKSEGIGHDSKTLISLTTNQVDVQYDDFAIKAVAKP